MISPALNLSSKGSLNFNTVVFHFVCLYFLFSHLNHHKAIFIFFFVTSLAFRFNILCLMTHYVITSSSRQIKSLYFCLRFSTLHRVDVVGCTQSRTKKTVTQFYTTHTHTVCYWLHLHILCLAAYFLLTTASIINEISPLE